MTDALFQSQATHTAKTHTPLRLHLDLSRGDIRDAAIVLGGSVFMAVAGSLLALYLALPFAS